MINFLINKRILDNYFDHYIIPPTVTDEEELPVFKMFQRT